MFHQNFSFMRYNDFSPLNASGVPKSNKEKKIRNRISIKLIRTSLDIREQLSRWQFSITHTETYTRPAFCDHIVKQKYRNTHTTNSIQRAKSITNQICYHTAAITQHIASLTHRQNSKAINVYQQKKQQQNSHWNTNTALIVVTKSLNAAIHSLWKFCHLHQIACIFYFTDAHREYILNNAVHYFQKWTHFFSVILCFCISKAEKNIVLFEFIMSIDEFHLFVFVKFGKDWYFGQQKRHFFLRCT